MKYFRIATEGATTDGRVISREWLTQMAKNYDPKKYGARLNLEHLRGVLPDGPFKAYGDVVALKVQDVEEGKLALFAQIDPTPELVELTKKRQKVYTSMEVDPNFARSNEAYLVGLAITDSPASLGTEMLKFAAGAQHNPLAARKQGPDNLFSEATEIELDFSDIRDPEEKSLFSKVKDMLSRIGDKAATTEARLSDAHQAVEALADHARSLTDKLEQVTIDRSADAAAFTELKFAHEKLTADFTALLAKLDKEPEHKHHTRKPATGGDGAIVTDC